jgi:hypothetical protein
MLVATALTLSLIAFALTTLADLARHDGSKIVAALQGRSWAAESNRSAGPVTIRFRPRYTAVRPALAQSVLRAAA